MSFPGHTLFDLPPVFDGPGIEPCDIKPLTGQLLAVFTLMQDGHWRTLHQIATAIGGASEAGVSARLRDLRKPRLGNHDVQRQRVEPESRTYEYRLVPKGVPWPTSS